MYLKLLNGYITSFRFIWFINLLNTICPLASTKLRIAGPVIRIRWRWDREACCRLKSCLFQPKYKTKRRNQMRHDQKPHRNRKPFKRKTGGTKFMLGSGTKHPKFSFNMSSSDQSLRERMANLLSLIFGKRKREQSVMILNK